jgi:hypothetical protein
MPSDRSRRTDPPRHGYTGVIAQQGRVILDRDFNALQGLTDDRIVADALDVVGPSGTPDDGFRISLPGGSPPPSYWSPPPTPPGSPPEGSPPGTSPPESPGGYRDFLIKPGIMYLGGQRVILPGVQNGRAITYSYFDQPDFPSPPGPPRDAQRELVYLELTEQEVGAVEDPDLLEVALGGPDTTQRLKLLRRVRRMSVRFTTCAAAWAEAVAHWASTGWDFDAATMRLLPRGRMQVSFTQDASAGGPCEPVATGGYLGADNQLIRLRIAGTTSGPQLVWGYDNASFLYRITSVSTDGTMLTLASDPPDGFHIPQIGQLVEVLRTAAVLGEEPDETDTSGQKLIVRAAADNDGILRQLNQTYGPVTTSDPTNYIVLSEALPAWFVESPWPLFLRIWQAELPLTIGAAITIADPVTKDSTGVTATISVPSGQQPADGAFWQIAVRPTTPQGVYPEDLLTSPQPPDGPRRWVCPLALIDWIERRGTVIDCRNPFDNLVTLTRRKPGCCTVSIGPADVTAATPLQLLIDGAAGQAQAVTVCLSGGDYALPAPLRLDARHAGMVLEACGGVATLRADPSVDRALFGDGLVVLTGAHGVTLRDLSLSPPQSAMPAFLTADLLAILAQYNLGPGPSTVFPAPMMSFGLRVLNTRDLTLQRCAVHFSFARVVSADLLAAGVFLQGNCPGIAIHDCRFGSSIGPTYTVVTVSADDAAPAALTKFNAAMTNLTLAETPGLRLSDLQLAGSPPRGSPPSSSPPVTSPPATSPPSDTAAPSPMAQLQTQIAASFDLLVSKRLAVGLAAPSGAVTTIGVVAAPYTSIPPPGGSPPETAGSIGFDCNLGDATIRDCAFNDLTFATVISAAVTTLRLQDNRVTGGVAGLWVLAPNASYPDLGEGLDPNYQSTGRFEEMLVAKVLIYTVPPPSDSLSNLEIASPPPQGLANPRVPAPYDLFVVGNQVQLLQSPNASAALYCLLNLEGRDTQPGTPLSINQSQSAVLISGNRLSSRAGAAIPVALLTLSWDLPCTITGNVVLNVSSGEESPSLWLIIEEAFEKGAPLITVTGNVLHGRTDLSEIVRPGVPAAQDSWTYYNTTFTGLA